ncbi:MAG: HlyC/CorC family transporter [Spirochaetes bacterium]|nr:HlyC/CorC family transporter [Spirochaetota bacterium]
MISADYIVYQTAILAFMALTFAFSAMETAIISSDPIRLRSLSEKGSGGAARALSVLENVEDSMGMLQIVINIIEISASAFLAFVATRAFMLDESALFLVTIAQTIVFLTFCEILPKVISRSNPERFLILFSYPIAALTFVFRPVTRFSLYFSGRIKTLLGLESGRYSFVSSRDDIGLLFKLGMAHGVIDADHHDYITEILSFNRVTAYEVMTPLIDVVSVERKKGIRHVVRLIEETRFSRIPVYEERVDNIVGYVYYRDLLMDTAVRSIDQVLKEPHFVPSTKKIHELFHEMREMTLTMVFVVNEFGAVEGLVTREDIAEEIVGEIQTRDHPAEQLISAAGRNRYVLSGNLDIDFFRRRFAIPVEKRGFETLAGFVITEMGRIPKKGERLVIGRHTLVVEEATDRSVEKLLLLTPGRGGRRHDQAP